MLERQRKGTLIDSSSNSILLEQLEIAHSWYLAAIIMKDLDNNYKSSESYVLN